MGALNTFPLSYKVSGKSIVILGGGDEALNKARLATKTTAQVVIISDQPSPDFAGLPVTVKARAFDPADLDGAALLFVAEHGPEADAAVAAARQRGIPVNVVDVPDRCDFYTPSIVDRAPVTVAISSEGDAPVLARLVRARIEAMLSPQLGSIARLAGELRSRVAALLPDGVVRRHFYEDLVTSPAVEKAIGQGVPEGRRAALKLLDHHANRTSGTGTVALIGAGPGSEDLLTLRAQRLLQEADVIVHDQLVPAVVVEMGRRDAQRIAVGKAKGKHSVTQGEINALLVRLAGEGKRVARLKSGDPMIFGRAHEELEALRAAGVSYSVVPGITAALAAAADTATPVTLRNVASGVVFATAHGAEDSEITHWSALARQGLTLGIYMGKSVAGTVAGKLIADGLATETPVGIVVNAGRADRSLHRGDLAALASETAQFADGPAIIFIGAAVAAGDWSEALLLAERAVQVA